METIVALIEESCRKFGDRTAFLHKTGGAWRETSYGELGRISDRIAAGLSGSGFQPGNHAALLAPSSPQWMMVYLGILKAGGVVVPIDKELKSGEVRHILGHSEAQALFVDGECLDGIRGMADEMPSLRRIITLDSHGEAPPAERCGRDPFISPCNGARCTVLSLCELLHEREYSPVQRLPGDTALILYTSGTTGLSKGAMLSHENIVSNIRGAAAHLEVDQSVHTLSFLPINHVFEQVCGILLPLSLGGKVSFCESLKKLGDNLAEVKPTFFVGVPAVFRMMLGRIMKKIEDDPLSRLFFSFRLTRPLVASRIRRKLGSGTIFVSGGAALDAEISRQFARLGITIFQGYGITETSPVISVECRKWRRPGTVGRVMAGVEVRIDNPDDEMVGEILVRGPNVMQGYYRDPDATGEVLVDGWYRTGDLGRLDDDGLLTLCGRVKNLIVTPNGRNVYPEEVENEILKSPFIAEVVVYPHRTGPLEEEIHAMIYPDREVLDGHAGKLGKAVLSGAEIEALIRAEVSSACERLAAYKRVRKFTIREEEFPKTTTRKIKRFEVEAMTNRPWA